MITDGLAIGIYGRALSGGTGESGIYREISIDLEEGDSITADQALPAFSLDSIKKVYVLDYEVGGGYLMSGDKKIAGGGPFTAIPVTYHDEGFLRRWKSIDLTIYGGRGKFTIIAEDESGAVRKSFIIKSNPVTTSSPKNEMRYKEVHTSLKKEDTAIADQVLPYQVLNRPGESIEKVYVLDYEVGGGHLMSGGKKIAEGSITAIPVINKDGKKFLDLTFYGGKGKFTILTEDKSGKTKTQIIVRNDPAFLATK